MKWRRKRKLILRYDALAKTYDELYRGEQAKKYNVSLRFVKLSSNDLVCDLGCGTGLFLKHINNNFVIGIDFSLKSLLKAKEKVGGGCLILADIEYLPLRKKCVDYAFLFTVIHHLSDPIRVLTSLIDVVRREIIFTVLKKPGLMKIVNKLVRNLPKSEILNKSDARDFIMRVKVIEEIQRDLK